MPLLTPPKSPALPFGTDAYDRAYMDKLLSLFRIYFNQVDSVTGVVLGARGGAYLNFPYAAIQRNTAKTFTANTATEITFDTNDFLNGCTNDGTNGTLVAQAGLYNYQFSVQWANTDAQEFDAWVWLRVNDKDVAGTGSQFTIPSKHGTENGHLVASANFYVQLNAGDYVKMYAAVSDPAVFMETYPAQTTPFAMPSVPSVVATLTFVSALV